MERIRSTLTLQVLDEFASLLRGCLPADMKTSRNPYRQGKAKRLKKQRGQIQRVQEIVVLIPPVIDNM